MDSSRGIAFMHIEKTGGTSVEWVLRKQFAPADICPVYHGKSWHKALDEAAGLLNFKLFVGHFDTQILEALIPTNLYRCTIIREPVSHFISNFNHIKRYPETPHRGLDVTNLDFAGYLDAVPNLPMHRAFQTSRIIGRRPFNKLTWRRNDFDKHAVELKRLIDEKLSLYNLVGTTEDLDLFYRKLCGDNGLQYTPVPRKNTAERRSEPDLLVREQDVSAEMKDRIRMLREIDIYLYEAAKRLQPQPTPERRPELAN